MARTSPRDKAAAERNRRAARERVMEITRAGQDIGDIPKVGKPRRRRRCAGSFRAFCETYFAPVFHLAWSADHLKVIGKIERAVVSGGLFAVAMPRGSGKTSLSECAVLWSLLCGYRAFVVLIGSDQAAAERMLESVKVELETNELLLEDYPEVCYPVACLERSPHRCRGQRHNGEPTYIGWQAGELVLPTVAGSKASGSVVKVAGLTGAIRGLKHKTADGRSVRPDLVVVDDPQTDESARSVSQCAYRERLLAGAVLGLAGPGKKISGIMPCTVIAPGDVADSLLDPAKHPEWNGERTKLLYALPERLDLWDRYAELRAESFRAGKAGACATEYYRQHRQEMDRGAIVAWPERRREDELSALQHAMNLRADDPIAFEAEYQNTPRPLVEPEPGELTPADIAGRINRHARGLCPAGSTRLTAFIDVQQDLLYFAVVAWSEGFTGAVIDAGAFPEQRKGYFTLREASPTLARAVGVPSLEGSLYAGLEALGAQILGRDWPQDGGGLLRVEKCLIDANWAASTDVVYRWCRQSAFAAIVTPGHGKGISASGLPMTEWPRRPGERRGNNWLMPVPKSGRGVRHVLHDANFWKSFLHARLSVPAGAAGAMTLWGDRPETHRLLADHLCAEHRVRTVGHNRELDEWRLRPHRPDNHLLDCLAGCCVAASMLGVSLSEPTPAPPRAPRRTLAELQAAARGR